MERSRSPHGCPSSTPSTPDTGGAGTAAPHTGDTNSSLDEVEYMLLGGDSSNRAVESSTDISMEEYWNQMCSVVPSSQSGTEMVVQGSAVTWSTLLTASLRSLWPGTLASSP